MGNETEPPKTPTHLELVHGYVSETLSPPSDLELLLEYSTHFARKTYVLLRAHKLPLDTLPDGSLAKGTVATKEVRIPVASGIIYARVQANLVGGGWEEWERGWRDLGLHFRDDCEKESSLLIPSVGWDGSNIFPAIDPKSSPSWTEFKNGLDILSYLEGRLS